jgi:hypothetical protein
VTRQAFPPDSTGRARHSLAPIVNKLKREPCAPFWENEKTKKTFIAGTKPLAQLGWPLYVGRSFDPDGLPSVTVDVEKLGALILVLLGRVKQPTYGTLGALTTVYRNKTGEIAGANSTFSEFWLEYLKQGDRLGPALASHTVTHAIAVRQIAKMQDGAKAPDFGESLEWAVEVVGKRFDPASPPSAEWLQKRIWWWNGKWASMNSATLKNFSAQRKVTTQERFAVAATAVERGKEDEVVASLHDAPSGNLVDRFDLIHPR